MRVLVLSHKPPYPIVDGGCLAMSRFLLDLHEIDQIEKIDYVTFSTHKHPFKQENYDALNLEKASFTGLELDTKIKVLPALYSLITHESYHTKRFLNKRISDTLLEMLSNTRYDFIVFESLYAAIYAPIVRKVFQGKILYRSHNIEYKIWEGLAKNQRNPLKKWYLQQLTKSLKKEEYAIWNEVDVILSISKEDTSFIQQITQKKVNYLPSSMPSHDLQMNWSSNRMCFIGAFDWEPNMEAVQWFIKDVLPTIKQQFPELEFHIAGRKSERIPEEWRQDQVKIHGFVEDPLAFIAENGLFVACLQSGSGIKMKVLEAMSIGAPCVLTTKAAEGLELSKHMPIHEDAESFALDIIELLQDQSKQQLRGALGKQFISSEFSTQMVKDILEKDLQAMASI